MNTNDIMVLGLGLQEPWRLINQHLDLSKSPHELQLEVAADRGGAVTHALNVKEAAQRTISQRKNGVT